MKPIVLTLTLLFLVISTFSQFSWTPSNNGLPDNSYVNDFALAENGDIFVILHSNQQSKLYKSTNNGMTWSQVIVNGLPTIFANSLFAKGNMMFIGTGNSGANLYISTNNGQDWTPSSSGLPNDSYVNDFAMTENGDIFIILNSNQQSKLYKSTNNGVSWSQVVVNGLPAIFANSLFTKGNIMFIGTGNSGADLYVSSNSGQDWIPSSSGIPNDSYVNDFALDENGDIYIVLNSNQLSSLYKSTNNGAAWLQVDVSGLPTIFANSLLIKNDLMYIGTGNMGQDLYKSAIVTSTENLNEQQALNLYPNPTRNLLIIEADQEFVNTKYTLMDQYGRTVMKGVLADSKQSISVGHLSSGMYLLTINNHPELSRKVIIQ